MERVRHLDKPHQISPHLYVVLAEIPHVRNANAYLVKGEENILIDCGNKEGSERLRKNLNQLDIDFPNVHHVVATHEHYDHINGFNEIKKANPDVKFYIHKTGKKAVETGNKNRTAVIVYDPDGTRNLSFDPIKVNKKNLLRDGQILELGEHVFSVDHTPGHSKASISLRAEIDDAIYNFVGDTYKGHANKKIGSNFKEWRESLTKMSKMDFDYLLNGHEWVTGLPITRQQFLKDITQFAAMWNPWWSLPQEDE